MKRIGILVVVTAFAVGGCGSGGGSQPAPGSPGNPVRAKADPGSEHPVSNSPSYRKLLARQSRAPRNRFTPCNLVSKARARAIIGAPISEPVEAPLGPTCIYRSRDGRTFVTVAVPSARLAQIERQVKARQAITVRHRRGFCAVNGRPMLYLPLAHGKVLSVSGPCPIAARFASSAVKQLGS